MITYPIIDSNSLSTSNNLESGALHYPNLPYVTANPDNTLLFAGPPRVRKANLVTDIKFTELGLVQNVVVQSQVPLRYVKGIGTRRKMPLRDSAEHVVNIAKMIVNGPNLIKALYLSLLFVAKTVTGFGLNYSPLADDSKPLFDVQHFFDLDSDIFYIPFGIGIAFENRANQKLGALYVEEAMISSWNISVSQGQSFVMDNVVVGADRIVSFTDVVPADQSAEPTFNTMEAFRKAYLAG